LGLRLFARIGRNVQLTSEGEDLLLNAKTGPVLPDPVSAICSESEP
jgi:hypothetical protein